DDEMRKILKDEGIKILTGVTASEIKKTGKNHFRLEFSIDDVSKTIEGTHLLIATGVTPNTLGLNLEAAVIETDSSGLIKVNNKLETNINRVYALGDVKGGPAFTHISYDDYRIVFKNIIQNQNLTTDSRLIPYVMFTDPELAGVGISETEAKTKGLNYKTAAYPVSYIARAIETNETRGLMKVLIEAESGKILGCSILGPEAGEIMSMIEIAMMGGLHYTKLKDAVFAHPTLAESLNSIFNKIND